LSLKVVALGGGHGLAASLSALRRVTPDVTAIVTVADDGGSSGRLRQEFGVLPPGDLRMALAALCGDDDWGTTWAQVVQHRFGGTGELAGHAVGNLLIAGLWDHLGDGDPVAALDWVARLLRVTGRVLPMAAVPLDIVASVDGADPAAPHAISSVRGRGDAGPGPVDLAGARGPPGRAGSGRGRAQRGLGGVRPRVVVYLRAAPPAGTVAGWGPGNDEGA
jgi:2-phospho-L-lactate transferase/gluconeogenesis factor (CofD/UPF0052 family)